MNSLDYRKGSIVYIDEEGEKILFDATDYLGNISRIPIHGAERSLTGGNIVMALLEEHCRLTQVAEHDKVSFYYSIVDAVVADYLTRHSCPHNSPIRVLELGCTHGIMAYHLTTLIGLYDKKSLYVGVCDTIGNSSQNEWLDYISRVERLPEISLVVADYDATNLKDSYFDIVIINGTVQFNHEENVLDEAKRLITDEGVMILFSEGQSNFEKTFWEHSRNCTEYSFIPQMKVLVDTNHAIEVQN